MIQILIFVEVAFTLINEGYCITPNFCRRRFPLFIFGVAMRFMILAAAEKPDSNPATNHTIFTKKKNGGQEQFSSRGNSGDGAATYLAYPLDTKSGNTRSEECEKRGEKRSAASRLVSGYPSNRILLLAHFKQTRERRIERGEWGWGGRSLQKRVHSPNASVEDVSLFSRFVLNFALCRLPTFFCPSGVPRLQPGWPASGQA